MSSSHRMSLHTLARAVEAFLAASKREAIMRRRELSSAFLHLGPLDDLAPPTPKPTEGSAVLVDYAILFCEQIAHLTPEESAKARWPSKTLRRSSCRRCSRSAQRWRSLSPSAGARATVTRRGRCSIPLPRQSKTVVEGGRQMALSTTIKSIQDIMRKDVGVDGDAQRIGQIAWMLFLKILDDQEREIEALGDYRSPLPKRFRWRAWAADREGLTGEALLAFVNNELFPALKGLRGRGATEARARLVRGVFGDAYNYMKSGILLRQVVNRLNEGIDFNDTKNRHLLGDLYEQILRDLQSAGNAGEFYTPRAVTEFMVERTDPRLGETVLDPACGTGGFLTATIDHVRRYVNKPADEATLQRSIVGVEKKPLPHLLCTTNLMLHGVEVPLQVRHDNILAKPLRDRGVAEQVDVILTNPPFGGMEEDGIEKNFPVEFQTRETADLFLVFILHVLKPGGRAAVVLPDGTLFGEGIKTRIKQRLLSECDLHTIVRLPKGVFAPYTLIQTNLLFFTKGRPTKKVWYYEHPYPDGQKSYSKTKPLRLDEFAPERAWWAKREVTERAWNVSAEDIAAKNGSLNWKNPHAAEAAPDDPDALLVAYEQASAEVAAVRDALRDALAKALTGP